MGAALKRLVTNVLLIRQLALGVVLLTFHFSSLLSHFFCLFVSPALCLLFRLSLVQSIFDSEESHHVKHMRG